MTRRLSYKTALSGIVLVTAVLLSLGAPWAEAEEPRRSHRHGSRVLRGGWRPRPWRGWRRWGGRL